MLYEVENKFPVADIARWQQRLEAYAVQWHDPIEQADLYFAHPARDFAATDEALRIRRVGETNVITYKGPKIDQSTKTRRELELPLASGGQYAAQYAELLVALGFRQVAEVRKHRRNGVIRWRSWSVQVALDQVERVGEFMELEIAARSEQLTDAQAALRALAGELGLPAPQRRSYLELLLAEE